MHQVNATLTSRILAVASGAALIAATASAGQPVELFIDVDDTADALAADTADVIVNPSHRVAGWDRRDRAAVSALPGDVVANFDGDSPSDSFTSRQRRVRINYSSLPANEDAARAWVAGRSDPVKAIRFHFFEDADFTATINRVDPTFSGGYSLSGVISGIEDGLMFLVVNDKHVAGTVRAPGGPYRIRPGPDGLHIVSQIDPSKLPPGAPPLVPPDSPVARDRR